MQSGKNVMQRAGMAVGLILFILFAFLSFRYKNNERIIAQNAEYISDAAEQKSQRMEYILRDAQKNLDILSYLYGQTITNGTVDNDDLREMADRASFRHIAFADKNGYTIDESGRNNNISDKEYFLRGMQGESGIDVVPNHRTGGKEQCVVFYAPFQAKDQIIGVLMGIYEEGQLEELLYSTYFGEQSKTYLCTEDGQIIAGSSDDEVPQNIVTYFEENNSMRADIIEQIREAFAQGASYGFRYDGSAGPGTAYITGINDTHLMIFQAFPSKITQNMINHANSAGTTLTVQLIAALVIYIAVILFLDRKKKKRLINENTEMSHVIAGTTKLFGHFILADLENNTYKYLAGTHPYSVSIRPKGKYSEFVRYFSSMMVDDEEKKRMAQELQAGNLQKKLKGHTVNLCYEYNIQRDKSVWERLNIVCLHHKNGMAAQVLFARQDVTAFKANELKKNAALKEAFQAAEMANRAKSDFLSRMSHDIRTPMNAIMGMTSIATMHIDDNGRVADCLNKITISSRHLLGLINEVLDMSKIESGKLVLTEEEFNISDIIENLTMIFYPQMEKKKQHLDITVTSIKHERVIGDAQRLQQVFVNIMGNAIKFTPEGGEISIVLHEKPSGNAGNGYYEFIFTDSGIGMDQEFIKHIFEPFSRADTPSIGNVEGTGLGMSIANNIIRMMNGSIQINSAPGIGSEFTVSVPLRLCSDAHESLEQLKGLSVLVVDDEQPSCENACEILKNIGMIPEWTTDGDVAIEKLAAAKSRGEGYAAVLLDWQMPHKDGMQMVAEIREKIGKDLPIIVLSASDLPNIEQDLHAVGINDFVAKPLFQSRLVYVLKNLVGKKPEDGSEMANTDSGYEGKRVLLVEDNELNTEIAVEILEMVGFEVDTACDGAEAVAQVSESEEMHYDLILMDIQMPNMNGYEATSAIRALDRSDVKIIPIIAMSANAFADDIRKAKESGMNAHVAKPIEIQKLTDTINLWIA